MINLNDNFDKIMSKIIEICSRLDLLGIELNNVEYSYYEFWVYDIFLDDNEESDSYNFSWKIDKKLYEQSEETQLTIKILLCQ